MVRWTAKQYREVMEGRRAGTAQRAEPAPIAARPVLKGGPVGGSRPRAAAGKKTPGKRPPEPEEFALAAALAQFPDAGRAWTVELPAGRRLLTENDRLARYPKAGLIAELRELGHTLAVARRLPKGLERAHVFYVVCPGPRGGRRDAPNWYPTAKAVLDGFVDYGLLPDDHDGYVTGVDGRRGPRVAVHGGQLRMVIIERTGTRS